MKRKPKRPPPLVPKALGRSAVSKRPLKDPEHLARVRAERCLACKVTNMVPAFIWGPNPTNAHHIRELFSRTAGRKISDYLTVPLCRLHHSDQSPWNSLHKHNNEDWWRFRGIDPRRWIAKFSAEGRAELQRIQGGGG